MTNKLIKGLDFTWDDIRKSEDNGNLLSFDLELSKACNLKCIYCYAESGRKRENEMTLEEIISIMSQAKKMGAQKVVIIGGGEPLMYPHYWDVVVNANALNLSSITFTNGTMINNTMAMALYASNQDIALKVNSFDENVQDHLAGDIKGTGKKIKRALTSLLNVGYSSGGDTPKLAIETIICNQNYNEIEQIYHFCRENNIIPYIEILTVQGFAKDHEMELNITPEQGHELFERLQKYDEDNWGYTWALTPPIVGQNCKRMYYSAYVTSTGEVQPCAGVDISGGNIREKSLKDIIQKSDIFNKTRNIGHNIQEPCKTCEYAEQEGCYGCRGEALHHAGDLFAADPSCWNLGRKKSQYVSIL